MSMSDTLSLPVANIEAAIECLLFVAGEPVPISELARALEMEEIPVESALRSFQVTLTERGSGLNLIRIAGGWQLATRPAFSEVVARLLTRTSTKLTRASMETLAIIAYRQPITAPEIEAVRGVSVAGVLKTLLERRLIREAGRKQALGRPMLYETTPDFLHYFAISDLSQLPAIDLDTAPPVSAEAIMHGNPSLSTPISDEAENSDQTEDTLEEN